MKFTVGTVSSSLDFQEDLKLIKSSLLYADEIELIGMAEYAVFNYLPSRIDAVRDIESLADAFIPLLKSISVGESAELVSQLENIKATIAPYTPYLREKKNRSKQEILAQLQSEKVIGECRVALVNAMEQFTNTPGATEIDKLITRNIVSVFNYGESEFNVDELAGGYFGNLIGTIKNDTAYPLFDSASADIISSFSKNKIFDLGNINQEVLVHAGVATNILMTLPTLEAATVDEILDFKKDMQGPLTRFRQAIYEFSEQIDSRPWDNDFQYDCLKIYGKEVAPKVQELNELASETSVLKNMGRKVLVDETIRKNASWIAGGLTTTITPCSNMLGAFDIFKNWLVGLSLAVVAPNAVSAFLKTLNMASESKQEIKETEKKMQGNTMYYYYKASKEIK